MALRNFRPRERSLVARRLGLERTGLYASSQLPRAARRPPHRRRPRPAHDLVLYDRDFDRMASQAWFRDLAGGARVAVRAGNTVTLHGACAAGAGIALLSLPLVRDPSLVRVLPALAPKPFELWAVTHGELRAAARVAVLLRWLEGLVLRSGFASGGRSAGAVGAAPRSAPRPQRVPGVEPDAGPDEAEGHAVGGGEGLAEERRRRWRAAWSGWCTAGAPPWRAGSSAPRRRRGGAARR